MNVWKSLLEYIKALGWWSWIVLLDMIGGVAGAILDISGIQFPTIIWALLLAIGLPIASFVAFHKVRLQRDALSIKDGFFFEPVGEITEKTGVVHLTVTFQAKLKVIVDKLRLDISGESFAPIKWMAFSVSPQYTNHWAFDLSKLDRNKTYMGRLKASADGKEHKSRDFEVHT